MENVKTDLRILVALLMLTVAVSVNADITIKVMKGGEAPYLYAYNESGTPVSDGWPGTQYSEKDADGYWTMTLTGYSKINIIFNDGNGTQTNDILNVTGVGGVARFMYDGATKWFGVMPDLTGNTEGCIYFNYPPDWGDHTPHIHFLNSSGGQLGSTGWPGYAMTYVGQDGAGFKVYKYDVSSWTGISKLIFNNDGNGRQTGNLEYVRNGYYDTEGSQAEVHALSASNGYSDSDFRAAITAQTGVAEGTVFSPQTITYLDVSGHGISSLAGIEHFTNLQTLLARNNSLSTVDLGSNPCLEVLDLSGNSALRGFIGTYSSNPTGYINLASGVDLKELYLANCDIGYFTRIQSTYGVTTLERLDLSGNSAMGGFSDGIKVQTGLKYLNVTGNAYGADALKLNTLTQLDTLIADNNPSMGNVSTLRYATGLRYVSLRNCGLTNSIGFGNNAALEYIDISNNSGTAKNFTLSNNQNLRVFKASNAALSANGLVWSQTSASLDTLIVSGNTSLRYMNSLQYATGLKYLDMSGGDLYLDNMPTFTGTNFPSLTYLDISSDRISAEHTLSGFAALETLKVGGNASMPAFTVNACPSLTSLDISGNTAQTTLGLTGQGYSAMTDLPTVNLTGCSSLNMLNLSDNLFTAVPDPSALSSSIVYLKLRNNALPATYSLTGNTTLAGLDLTGNTAVTDLTISGTNLSAIMLGGLTALTHLDLSDNPNITTTAGYNTDANLTSGVGRVYLSESTALEDIDISGCNIRGAASYNNFDLSHCTSLTRIKASGNTATTMTHFQAADMPASVEELYLDGCTGLVLSTQLTALSSHKSTLRVLDVTDCGIATIPSGGINGYSALETLRIGENPGIISLSVTGNASLTDLEVENNSGMTTLTSSGNSLSNIDVTGCSALAHLDLSSNQFSSFPDLSGSVVSWLDMSSNNIAGIPANALANNPIVTLKLNNSSVSDIANASTYPNLRYLYVQDNNFGANYEFSGNMQLKGLAISNAVTGTAMTTFKAQNNTSLESLDLSGNSGLTRLELHGNSALTRTTATAGAIESEAGLYVKGLGSLRVMDISNSAFEVIGQNHSLQGVPLDSLKASHNAFTTFTNSNYNVDRSGDVNYRPASYVTGKPSLEDLTTLKYLDLSYNQIADSVHLMRNTALKYLDVSHNQILGPLATTEAEKAAMIQKKIMAIVKYSSRNPATSGKKSVGLSVAYSNALRDSRKVVDAEGDTRYFDFRPCDLRDTVGIYHLDLHYNTELEYLDFSYTNIHNTAAGRIYMCPSWDRTGNWDDYVTTGSPDAANGPTKHHFVWFQPCYKLKVIKADHNNMQSMGLNSYPYLDTVSCVAMYGDCNFMADYRGPGYGNKGFPNGMAIYDHLTDKLNTEGTYDETLYYRGVSGTVYSGGATGVPVADRYPSVIRYADFSESGLYNVNATNGVNLVTLNVSGNPLQGGNYTATPLDVTACANLVTLDASGCDKLLQVNAHGLNNLETLDVTGCVSLETLRAYDDPVLYESSADFITGLSDCSALKELWVSNDNIDAELDVSGMTNLETLKIYDNATLPELDVTSNAALKYLDLARCNVAELDLQNNVALEYLDCSNMAAPTSMSEAGKNKISELAFASTSLREVYASNNNLYSLTGLAGNTLLTNLEFAHNHINGVDLSGCTSLTAANISDEDNGRTITAEYNVVSKNEGGTVTNYDVYFFQTDATAAQAAGHTFLSDRTATDVLKGTPRADLSAEGFDISKVTAWTGNATVFNGSKASARRKVNTDFDPADASDILDPNSVSGTVVLLDAANPTAQYTYDNGVSTSTYYLAWTAPSLPTAVETVAADGFEARGGQGTILIESDDTVEVKVVTVSGAVLRNEVFQAGKHVIDGVVPGIYLVNGVKVLVK